MDGPISCHTLQNIRSVQYTPSLRYLQAEENALAGTAVRAAGGILYADDIAQLVPRMALSIHLG